MTRLSGTNMGSVIDALCRISGHAHVTDGGEEIKAMGCSETDFGILVRPGSVEELADIVSMAVNTSCNLLPIGCGTQLRQVLTGGTTNVGVCMGRLNQVVEFEPDNLSISAEAGITTERIQALVGEKNLQLPVFCDFKRSSIGGQTATDYSSWKRYKYGSMSDYVMGLSFVTPSGKLVKTGGKTVKNVSGYDFTKLLGGSWGTMGILYSVTVKLLPQPEKEVLVTRSFPSFTEGLEAGLQLMQGKPKLSSCNLYSNSIEGQNEVSMLLSIEGSLEFVESQLVRLKLGKEWRVLTDQADCENIKDVYFSNRRGMKEGFFNTVIYGRRDIRNAHKALDFITPKGCIWDLDMSAGVLEFGVAEVPGMASGGFWEEWMVLGSEYPDYVRLFSASGYRQPLLDKLQPAIDPYRVMSGNTVFSRRCDLD